MAGPGLVVLDLGVLAIRHLGKENARIALRVERFLLLGNLLVLLVVGARAWIFSWRVQLVFDIDCRLEDFPNIFRRLEVTDWRTSLACVHVGVIKGRTNSVEASTCVHIHVDLFRWDRSWLWLQLVDLVFVAVAEVLLPRLVQV